MIGPSNPVISIGPILAVPGMREAIAASGAPVVAVSPFVAGAVVKGPTERFMAAVGRPSTAAGVASLYAGLIDAMVVDEDDPDPPPAEIPTLAAPTLMEGAAGRARLARIVLDYALELQPRTPGAQLARLKATAVLPVKRFDAAKQRLAAGIDDERREALVAAMLEDVLEAIGEARDDRADDRRHAASPRARQEHRRRRSRLRGRRPTRADERPLRGGAGRDRPRRGARRRLRRPAPRRLPAARPARARPAADRRPGALRRGRPRPPRHRHQRAGPRPAAGDPARLRRGQLRPPRRRGPRGGRPLRGRGAALAGARPRHPGRRRRPDPRARRRGRPRPAHRQGARHMSADRRRSRRW